MDDDTSIKIKLETMDSKDISAIKDKLEALKSEDIAEDAVSVRMSIVKMCQNIIAERIISKMRQTIVATVDRHNLTVKDRIDHIISIIEDSFTAIRWPHGEPIVMFFEELADDERGETRDWGTCFESFGFDSNTSFRHYVGVKTSPAGTAITVDTCGITVQSSSRAEGKKKGGPKLSIAKLKAMVAASGVEASLKNPPNRTLATPPNRTLATPPNQTLVNPPELKEQ